MAVVVLGVFAKHTVEVAAAEDQVQSRHSARIVRMKRSAWAFAFGDRASMGLASLAVILLI